MEIKIELFPPRRNHCGVHDQKTVTGAEADPVGCNNWHPGVQLRFVLSVGLWNEWTLGE